jgi:hypothetical protein
MLCLNFKPILGRHMSLFQYMHFINCLMFKSVFNKFIYFV